MSELELEKRSKETQKVGIIGIFGNVFLFIIKIVIALASKSNAMLADSINSGTDVLSSLMTFIGGKIAGEPSDDEHNYGHGKAEYIFSLIISLIMGYLAIKIAWNGIESLINETKFEFSYALVIVCVITILTKFALFSYTNKLGKKSNNILILANSQDHINDVYITISVLIGTTAALFNLYWLDGVVAIGIAIRICYSAIEFFMQSYDVLLDKSMTEKEIEEIKEIIKTYKKITRIDKVTSKSVGNSFVVIIKVAVDGNMTVRESHDIVGKMKAEVLKKKGVYDVVVHVNPVDNELE